MSYPPRLVPFYKKRAQPIQRHDCSYRVSLNELLATLPEEARELIGQKLRYDESIFHLSSNRLIGHEMAFEKGRSYNLAGLRRRYGPTSLTKRVIGVSIRRVQGKFVVVLRTEEGDRRPDVDVDLSLLPETAPPDNATGMYAQPPSTPRYSTSTLTSISSSTRGYFTTVGLNYFYTR